MTRYFVPAFLLLTLLCFNASAATLFGRVVEVNDGDVITVFNLNRPVRIKLLAVDAPERDQLFGDVAKKHLSELVYDKSVLVEYSGIASDGSLVGRVTLNNVDIGAQMIRDGVAWFDTSNQDRLSASDREVYQQSELAARNEKRGLWQGENPIAPWEFAKAKAQRREPAASVNAVTPAAKRPKQNYSELTNLTLITDARPNTATTSPATASISSLTPAGTSAATPRSEAWAQPSNPDLAWATDMSPKQWRAFSPPGENFTAQMPADGQQEVITVPFDGTPSGTADVNVYKVRDGYSFYTMIWVTAPSFGESDRSALIYTVGSFLKGLGQGYHEAGGGAFSCELEGERKLPAPGYTAIEFDLHSCTVPGKMRAFTTVRGGQRQMYIGATFSWRPDPNVSRFLNSFTVSASRTPGSPH
ncbi:MAG TPA: thermonuclease family protein [Pyrinomonadaceae bacterium]